MLTLRQANIRLDEVTRTLHVEASLTDGDVYEIFTETPEDARSDFALRALKIGVLALRDVRTVAKTDYVEKEFQRMRQQFDVQMEAAFGADGRVMRKLAEVFGDDGAIDQKMKKFFGDGGRFEAVMEDFLGEEGKLHRCLDGAVGEDGKFHRVLDDFLGEGGQLQQEFEREFGPEGGRLYKVLNPNDKTTPLGQLRHTIEERFDPTREGSALWTLKHDFQEQIEALRRDLGIQEAVDQERAKGHAKGLDFEEHVTELLNAIAAPHGDRIEQVGGVKGGLGDVGDVVSMLNSEATGGLERRIVVEVKNRKVSLSGKASIHKELEQAIQNRDAHFAIAVVARAHAGSFAPLQYVAPNHILVAVDPEAKDSLPLQVAYQMARALVAARANRREAQLDVEALAARLKEVSGHLEAVRAMKTNLTGAVTNIQGVKQMLDQMRENIELSVEELLSIIERTEESTDGGR